MRKKGWILLLVLLGVAFLMSCGKDTEPDEAKGELVRIEREGCQAGGKSEESDPEAQPCPTEAGTCQPEKGISELELELCEILCIQD